MLYPPDTVVPLSIGNVFNGFLTLSMEYACSLEILEIANISDPPLCSWTERRFGFKLDFPQINTGCWYNDSCITQQLGALSIDTNNDVLYNIGLDPEPVKNITLNFKVSLGVSGTNYVEWDTFFRVVRRNNIT